MKKWILITMLPAILMMAAVGCKKEKDDSNNNNNNSSFDRGAMLANYADNYVIPAYADMTGKLSTLKTKTDAFVAAPDETKLAETRAAWKAAYLTWQETDLLEFGPEASISLRNYINTFPVTVSKVNGNIAAGTYDLEQFGNKDAQGFPALDYLLTGLGTSDAAIVSFYTTDAQAANRKLYLQAIVNKMVAKVGAVQTAWGTYRGTFVGNTATDAGSSISLMTNAFVLYYERYLRSGKIGLPAGAMTGVAAGELTEAYYTPTLSKELAQAALNSVGKFYNGFGYSNNVDGIGFHDYMKAIGTKDDNGKLMADVINTELDEAKNSLGALTATIRDGVTTQRTEVLNIYQQLQEVVPLFKVDMVSAFGISITYTDNDGD